MSDISTSAVTQVTDQSLCFIFKSKGQYEIAKSAVNHAPLQVSSDSAAMPNYMDHFMYKLMSFLCFNHFCLLFFN